MSKIMSKNRVLMVLIPLFAAALLVPIACDWEDPISSDPIVSREWFEWERDYIFKKCWLNIGTADEIPNVGDYIVREIQAAKASVLVVRAKDGVIRAFHNVCRHRGNKLVWDYKGNKKGANWACRFHGFVYGGDGEL